jgi:BirA family biotin operon repressor/biotin-[acetyl-CoA-carboxylase] ligase
MCGGRAGLAVLAGRQTAGRGRLGRAWSDGAGASLAMTLVLDGAAHEPARVALAAGVAAAETCDSVAGPGLVGLKWPNDVVARTSGGKLAGVLVESRDGLLLLGVGINASGTSAEWLGRGVAGAASLSEMCGRPVDRVALAAVFVARLTTLLGASDRSLLSAWHDRDLLTGTRGVFEHDGVRYEGIVESIDPTLTLVVRTDAGLVRLPALTTSTVRRISPVAP